MVILWKLLDENDAFLRFSTKKKPASALVVPILFLMNEGRKEPSKVGMIHICTFILLFFSGERDFCVSLNQPFNQRLPTDLPLFEGTVADLVIITLHKLIVSGYERLNSVYNCFLTVISNISPYCKKLSMVSSNDDDVIKNQTNYCPCPIVNRLPAFVFCDCLNYFRSHDIYMTTNPTIIC